MTAPTRWKDSPDASGVERRAGALFRRVPPPEPLDDERLERIESRIAHALLTRRIWPAWLKRALAAFALVGAPLAFAAIARAVWPEPAPTPAPPPPVASAISPVAPEPAPEPAGLLSIPDELGVDLTEAPAPRRPADEPVRVAAQKAPAAPVATPATRSEPPSDTASQRASEASLLQRAVVQLRLEKDPAGALATLDQHRREFPRPLFLGDAVNHRVSALVALGRKSDALAELERFDASELKALDGELLLLARKGELLTELGRAREAVQIFDDVLDSSPRTLVEQRAVYGRAVARARLNDHAGSRADLERYLERWPNGPHAAQVRAALSR